MHTNAAYAKNTLMKIQAIYEGHMGRFIKYSKNMVCIKSTLSKQGYMCGHEV